MVLHPDELHDGQAGTEIGFRYQAAFIAPEQIQEAIANAPLPFLSAGVTEDPSLIRAVSDLLTALDTPLDPFEYEDLIEQIAVRLGHLEGQSKPTNHAFDPQATDRASEFIRDNRLRPMTIDDITEAADIDRWSLSRTFKARFGTSPYRYLTLRRLDDAVQLMARGQPLSQIADYCQFSDQSHFNRHFKRTYGITPARWVALASSA